MRRRASILIAFPLMAVACALNARPNLSPSKMAELWSEPADLTSRNLFYGPGGRQLAPQPEARYDMLSVDTKGFSTTYTVVDDRGREWSVKLGPEARTEVAASRLVWAVGYHQPDIYYVPRWTLQANGKTESQPPARFRLERPTEKKVGDWSWRNNPFLGTRPFSGLFVLMVMLNNWDLKSPQNALYRIEREGQKPATHYVVRDLGASFGKTSWWLPGTRDDPEAFEREPFIKTVEGNRVKFAFKGAWQEPQLVTSATPEDVQWMCGLLAKLSPSQWTDAFRAGGYSDAEASRYVRRLQEKVAEGRNLGKTSVEATEQ